MKITVELFSKYNIKSEDTLEKYIKFCFDKNQHKVIKFKTELHHILPVSLFPEYSCLIGNKWNGSHLLYKDHYIAHSLLAEALDELKATAAWNIINNVKKEYKIEIGPTSFALIKEKHSRLLSKQKLGTVNVKDITTGKNLIVSREEYFSNNNLITHSTGRVNVVDKTNNKRKIVTVDEYKNNNDLKSLSEDFVNAINIKTGVKKRVTKEEYYSNDELKFSSYGDVVVNDISTGKIIRVTSNEYNNGSNFISLMQNKVNAYNILTEIWQRVPKDDVIKHKELIIRKTQKFYLIDSICMRKQDASEYLKILGYKSTFGNFLLNKNKNKIVNSFEELTIEEYKKILKDTNETPSNS